jgi:hypothetical protein
MFDIADEVRRGRPHPFRDWLTFGASGWRVLDGTLQNPVRQVNKCLSSSNWGLNSMQL